MNKKIKLISEYPFVLLDKLLEGTENKSGNHLNLAIGEPQNNPPKKALEILEKKSSLLSVYPTSYGIESLRTSYSEWLSRRFELQFKIDPCSNVLPVAGTREGIFSFIQSTIDSTQNNPLVVMPNPFYKIYEGATLLSGGQCHFLDCKEEQGFKPDFESISAEVWNNCQLLILCSPSNPTGYSLNKEEYKQALQLAERYNFIVCSDECYVDIYPTSQKAPVGLLQVVDSLEDSSNFMVFHSLSKRSNLAGLRSGFACGPKKILDNYHLFRTYHGVALPLPTQHASSWAWSDDLHVLKNRENYDKKFNIALNELAPIQKMKRPDGAFYLWIKTPEDDQLFTKKLFEKYGVIVLPGSFLGAKKSGKNPGKNFVRIAIVHENETVKKALHLISLHLSSY